MQDPQLTSEQPKMAIPNSDTQEIIPKGTANPVDQINDPIKFVDPETNEEDCPPINVEIPHTFLMQAMLDWHYEKQDIHLLSRPLTEVIVNTVIKGDSFTWAPHVTLPLQYLATT